jgi:hypothetical protein
MEQNKLVRAGNSDAGFVFPTPRTGKLKTGSISSPARAKDRHRSPAPLCIVVYLRIDHFFGREEENMEGGDARNFLDGGRMELGGGGAEGGWEAVVVIGRLRTGACYPDQWPNILVLRSMLGD